MSSRIDEQQRNRSGIVLGTAVAFAAVAALTAGWLHGARTASAPEPAKLAGSITPTTTLVPAYYLSGAATTVIRWPSSGGQARADGSPRAGQPCTTVYLAAGATTKQVIVAVGSSRLCY
jgi:hypothetical protein